MKKNKQNKIKLTKKIINQSVRESNDDMLKKVDCYTVNYQIVNYDGKSRCAWCKVIVDSWTDYEVDLHIDAHDWSEKNKKKSLASQKQRIVKEVVDAKIWVQMLEHDLIDKDDIIKIINKV